jgi:hypothetical protein
MSDHNNELENNVITILDGKWRGVQYIVRNIEFVDDLPDGNNFLFEYDLLSDLGDKKEEFELWLQGYIQDLMEAAIKDYIENDQDDKESD